MQKKIERSKHLKHFGISNHDQYPNFTRIFSRKEQKLMWFLKITSASFYRDNFMPQTCQSSDNTKASESWEPGLLVLA